MARKLTLTPKSFELIIMQTCEENFERVFFESVFSIAKSPLLLNGEAVSLKFYFNNVQLTRTAMQDTYMQGVKDCLNVINSEIDALKGGTSWVENSH